MLSLQLEPRRGIRNDGIRRPQEAGAAAGQTQEGGVLLAGIGGRVEASEACYTIWNFVSAGLGYSLEEWAGGPRLGHFFLPSFC